MAKGTWLFAGLAAGLAALLAGARKARAAEPDDGTAEPDDGTADLDTPIADRPGYGQAVAYHDNAMRPEVTDLAYLAQVANWLEERGFPELAEPIRNKWELQRMTGAAQPRPEDRPGYGQAKAYYDHAMATVHDPAILAQWAATLTAQGFPEFGQGIAAKAASYTPSSAPITDSDSAFAPAAPAAPPPTPLLRDVTASDSIAYSTPGVAPTATPPGPTAPGVVTFEPEDDETEDAIPPSPPASAIPPIAAEETSEDLDPQGTVFLARILLAREGSSGWKEALQSEVKAWQSRVGLTADGKFGPGSAERMAREVGVLPLVRFWPLGEWRREVAVDNYRARIERVAQSVEAENSA
ncbi:MAG: hypothetical protein WC902_11435, partial [Bacteroidales bacterium]